MTPVGGVGYRRAGLKSSWVLRFSSRRPTGLPPRGRAVRGFEAPAFSCPDPARILFTIALLQARSSGGEHYLDTVGVSCSNPLGPTILPPVTCGRAAGVSLACGTGPAARDVTPEATRTVLERELPGFGEIMRLQSYPKVKTAILSRATAGVRGRSLIINLPGRPRAIGECLPLLTPAIAECLDHIAGFRPALREPAP